MKIVLTGFMGTGKTSVGNELANLLGYRFADTDDIVEEREGMPISLIFKKKGEDYFRSVERSVIREISADSRIVIATGGGVIKNPENVMDLANRGILVWLRAAPEIILKRVMLEDGKRPLLDVEEPLEEIKRLLEERLPLYEQADLAIDTDYITPREAALEIMDRLCLDGDEVYLDLAERSYSILIGSRLISKIGLRVLGFRPSRVAVISNETVFPLYGEAVLNSLRDYGLEPYVILVPDGEEYKDFLWAYHLLGELLKRKFDRHSMLIALGGGVIGDITGFVASAYMRGIRYIQVPTTLLAQVDSSIGGKTGVNHPLGKNMIGAFHQPSLVVIDVDTLRTLPEREFNAGMAEIIKYGVIRDRRLCDYLKSDRNGIVSLSQGIIEIVRRSCEIKADVVTRDERESGLRAILNFGHTIGHAIETVTGYTRYLHGEAVAIGMCVAAELAVKADMLSENEAALIRELVESYNLPVMIPRDLKSSDLIEAMVIDKKAKAGKLRFVLPDAIGRVKIVDDVDRDLLGSVLEASREQ
jgi:3-dehydroquinate synthase